MSSIGPDYARYASRVAADSVTGATVEFIFQHNTKYGEHAACFCSAGACVGS